MSTLRAFFEDIYAHFNLRHIDYIIEHMTPDVKWANGMEGGYVMGHDGVRAYWNRQFNQVQSQVTPTDVRESQGKVVVEVHQVVHDNSGKLLADQQVTHVFTLRGDRIATFDIGLPRN